MLNPDNVVNQVNQAKEEGYENLRSRLIAMQTWFIRMPRSNHQMIPFYFFFFFFFFFKNVGYVLGVNSHLAYSTARCFPALISWGKASK